ncbi:DUF4142 domain-containing protein [Flavobacterium sp. ST-87]|uniref:DUF4142 domain-containing protein n=1 Tax=Flavobacterium plantiphilum TaxID=3163297 RepID=A0ABW8XWF0_9FLAO
MKKIILSKIILGAALALFTLNSCKNESKQEDPKEVAEEQNEANIQNENVEDDADHLVDAAAINLCEIEIGKLAQEKGMSQDVKKFGKMLVTDHEKALEETKTLADKKAIILPSSITEDGRDKYNKLKDESAEDFDKKFADMMVDGHQDAIDKMEKIAEKANDADIKTWAANQISPLTAHLTEAKRIQEMQKNK